jgi:hypothetical protein
MTQEKTMTDDLTPLQKFLVRFTFALAILIIVLSLVMYIMGTVNAPDPPTLADANNNGDAYTRLVSGYKEVIAPMQGSVYEYTVLRTLLPMFNALIAAVVTFILGPKLFEIVRDWLNNRRTNGRG